MYVFFAILLIITVSSYSQNNEDVIKAVSINQTVPDFTLKNVYNYNSSKLNISQLRGKAVIIDFWGSWCKPCIAALPKMQKLKRQFAEKLEIITVTFENKSKLDSFFAQHPNYRTTLVGACGQENKFLSSYFPHVYIPHEIWIDQNGVIKAITSENEVTDINLQKLINNIPLAVTVKNDFETDPSPTFVKHEFIHGTESNLIKEIFEDYSGGNKIRYQSILTGFTRGLFLSHTSNATYPNSVFEDRRISIENLSVLLFYKIAFGYPVVNELFPSSRIVFEIKDSIKNDLVSSVPELNDTSKFFCYNLIIPEKNRERLFMLMQGDLERYFGIKGKVEARQMNGLSLVISDTSKYLLNVQNQPKYTNVLLKINARHTPSTLVKALNDYYGSKIKGIIFFNDVTLKDNFLLEVNNDFSDIDEIKRQIKTYGLTFQPVQKNTEILLLTDYETNR